MEKSTHRGHCQVCGRIQAIVEGKLSKHGYTVAGFGYFHGVCSGAAELPLEQDRAVTDGVVVSLNRYAVEQDALSAAYMSGARKVTHITRRGVYVQGKRIDVTVPVAEATVYEIDAANKSAAYSHESNGIQARAHAKMLVTLAQDVHGNALLPIKEEKEVVVAPVVDIAAGTVTGAYRTKAARQADLDSLNRKYDVLHRSIQEAYLASNVRDNSEAMDIYYGPSGLHAWRAKHSATVRKFFPQLEQVVIAIEQLAQAREAVKKA